MNSYIKNLNRIEFLITLACTGKCKHCSEGDHSAAGGHIDGDTAAEMVRKVAENYNIKSLMTFGGEPLLYPDEVFKIHAAARDVKIPKRQLITNGFFSRDSERIRNVAGMLVKSGVNDILLSVDAFHQETIPLEPVMAFAEAVLDKKSARLRTQPAWLVKEEAENPYNCRTREILDKFRAMGIEESDGNVVFPSGNAVKYLQEYFDPSIPQVNPYVEDPQDIRAICVDPNGDVLGDNIHETGILEILENYSGNIETN